MSPARPGTVSPRCGSPRPPPTGPRCRAHWRAAALVYSSSSARHSSRAAPKMGSRPSNASSAVTRSASGIRCGGTVTPGGVAVPVAGRSVLLDGLDLEVELGLLADEHAAGLEGHVPGETEVLPVHLGRRREAGPAAAPGIGRPPEVLDVERDGPGYAVHGEVTLEAEPTRTLPLHPGAPEGDLRVALDVEEVGRAQVPVPLLVAGLHAGRVDVHFDPRAQRVLGDVDVARDTVELAPYLAHHQVAGREVDARVRRIQLPVARLRDLDALDAASLCLAHGRFLHPRPWETHLMRKPLHKQQYSAQPNPQLG